MFDTSKTKHSTTTSASLAQRLDNDERQRYEYTLALLKQPQTYPEKAHPAEIIQTHMSWVFLTERYAYKMKKPVRYDFLDFSTLAARRHNCCIEVTLNRRLAGDVYIGAVPLVIDAKGQGQLEGSGKPIEWLVKMQRLPKQRMLDALIADQKVIKQEIQSVARLLTGFYQKNTVRYSTVTRYREQLARAIRSDCEELAKSVYGLPTTLIGSVRDNLLALIDQHPRLFDERIYNGRIVEGHGDLRPEHICLLKPKPIIFDCLEFNRSFRIVDSVDELAFLALECERLGAAFVEPVLFANYSEMSGDYPAPALVNFYKTYRACLRAKLSVWHTHELTSATPAKWLNRARDYLRLAERFQPMP